MAISGAAIAKAAAAVLSNEKLRKGVGWIVVAILSPIIVLIALIGGLLSGGAEHNNNALEVVFNGGIIGNVPIEYQIQIENMQTAFDIIDREINSTNDKFEDDSLDEIKVKAVFYSLFFGNEKPQTIDCSAFLSCFYKEEERTRINVTIDEDGNKSSYEETYTVYIPITDMGVVYGNITNIMGKQATTEDMSNTTEIYYRSKYGIPAPTYGAEFDDFIASLPTLDIPFVGIDGFVEPIAGWRNIVTSEYGERIHPITKKRSFHTGIDLGVPKGTPIYSVLDGTVTMVRYSTTGYGYHVIVDHGGGFITLYAHCSKILVNEGQTVIAGQVIAEVGTTGMSTGNHLHFEVKINGETQNPRSYLP